MFDYLQQFNKLPKDLRDQVSSPSAMAVITELEQKYKVDLAATVMKIMVKNIAIKDLPSYFMSESNMASEDAGNLVKEMKERIFLAAASYLGLSSEQRALDLDKDVNFIIKEAGLSLPSEALVGRFKNILATYLRGVRSKIDTRNSLSKDVKIGGLNFNPEEIDRIFKTCTTHKFSSLAVSKVQEEKVSVAKTQTITPAASVPPRLAQIMAQSDQVEGYNLKQAILTKQTKLNQAGSTLDTAREISAPKTQLDLPKPKITPAILPPTVKTLAPVVAITPVASGKLDKPSVASSFFDKATKLMSLPSKQRTKIPKPVISPTPTPLSAPHQAPIATSVPQAKVVTTVKAVVPPISGGTAASRPTPAPSPRPVMHDIKPMPKVMGPIEELQFLDLVNFRRLGSDAGEAVNKVFAKIKLLEKDGYDKMVLGVKAWRQSPVNRLYLRLGQEAIVKGRPFKDILVEKQKSGQDSLSQEEVSAIIKLNSKLIF